MVLNGVIYWNELLEILRTIVKNRNGLLIRYKKDKTVLNRVGDEFLTDNNIFNLADWRERDGEGDTEKLSSDVGSKGLQEDEYFFKQGCR